VKSLVFYKPPAKYYWRAEHVSPKNGQFVIDTRAWESKTKALFLLLLSAPL
jgi:hypothetical protein